jgi:tRNA dimethylallyltransferase
VTPDVPTVFAVAGPTGAGKTALALELAERHGAVVLSADAMQVYRGFDVGTAKATTEERRRVPHVGIDVRDPHESFDAGDFLALAHGLLRDGRRVIVCGGTHLYVQALRRGLVETPPPDADVRAAIDALDDPWAALRDVDPELAARLHPNDRVRVARGLEVFRATGRRLSALQADHAAAPDAVRVVGVWLDRDDLRDRLAARLSAMVAGGYLDEVRALLEGGVSPDCKPMKSLGYRHLGDVVRGDVGVEEAIRRTERDTWELARKQRNWGRVLDLPRLDVPAARALAAGLWPI